MNKDGYRYLQDYGMGPETPLGEPKNKYMELGPRDKVSRAFWHEWRAGRTIATRAATWSISICATGRESCWSGCRSSANWPRPTSASTR